MQQMDHLYYIDLTNKYKHVSVPLAKVAKHASD